MSWSLLMRPACFNLGMTLQISMQTHPSIVVREFKLYSLIILSGILGDVEFHVFVSGHGGTVVKLLGFEGAKTRIWQRNGTVEKDFGGDKIGCLGGHRTRKVKTVATATIMYRIVSGILEIHDFAPGWYVAFADEKNCLSTGNPLVHRPTLSNPLC